MQLADCEQLENLTIDGEYAIELEIVEPAVGVYFMGDNISNNQSPYSACGENCSLYDGIIVEPFADPSLMGQGYCVEFSDAARSLSFCPVDAQQTLWYWSQTFTNFCDTPIPPEKQVKAIRSCFSSFLEAAKPVLMIDMPSFIYDPNLVASGTAVKVRVSLVSSGGVCTTCSQRECDCLVNVGVFE